MATAAFGLSAQLCPLWAQPEVPDIAGAQPSSEGTEQTATKPPW